MQGSGAVAGIVGRRRGHLASKGALVDLALVRAAEGEAVVLELPHRLRRLLAHVLDCILRHT